MPERTRALGLAVLLACIAVSATVRIQAALSDPDFDGERVERMLKSDPGLLYYVTARIVGSGGLPPPDFRADPRVEHPGTTDIPAMETVGQEFLVAWLYLLFGGDMPLHVFCVVVMGIVASLTLVGVYGLALELTGRASFASLAALLHTLSPASYRTVGFILIREDLSLPCFALHLYLLARASRRGTRGAHAAAGVALLAALATWHAMGFVVAIEVACLLAWSLRSGERPLAAPGAWVLPAVVGLGSLLVPALRAKGFLLSLPMLLTYALAAPLVLSRLPRLAPRLDRRVADAVASCALLALLLALARVLAANDLFGLGDYSHVEELMWSKLRFLGALPADPRTLSFDARLLWQGPFETASVRELIAGFTVGSVLLPVGAALAAPLWWRGRGDARLAGLALFALGCAIVAVGVRRNLVLPGLVTPALSVLVLQSLALAPAPWVAGLGLAQAVAFAGVMPHRQVVWYSPVQQDEIAAVVGFVRGSLPAEGAVASDFVNSTALLAHTGHPIWLQPKYESRKSRRRIQEFLEAFFRDSPLELRDLLRRDDCRYLLVDRQTLWGLRYTAGLPSELREPVPGTAAASLLAEDASRFASVPGFRLIYRSTLPSDMIRLYEVE